MTYEYEVTRPDLPPGAVSPMMDCRQMTDWLNARAARGWELVTYGQTLWNGGHAQEWWVFRRRTDVPPLKEQKP